MGVRFRFILICFVPILIIGSFIRFTDLSERGYFEQDEATYHQIARSNYLLLSWVGENWGKPWPADYGRKEALLAEFDKQHVIPISNYATKPLYQLINFISVVLIGKNQSALLYMNAFLGCLTIVLMYWLGKDIFKSHVVGVLAGGCLAFSVLHTEYSRSAMPSVAEVFFFTLGLYLYLYSIQNTEEKRIKYYLGGAGLAFGCTFLVHPNALPFLGVVFFTESFCLLHQRNLIVFFKHCLFVYGFFVVPEVIADMFLYSLKWYIQDDLNWLYSSSFLGNWNDFNQLQTNLELLLRLPNDMVGSYSSLKERVVTYVLFYPLGIEGVVYTILILLGLGLTIKVAIRDTSSSHFAISASLIPYIFFIFIYKTAMLRSVSLFLPYAALAVGLSGSFLFARLDRFRYRIPIFSCLCLLFLTSRWSDLHVVVSNQSGFVKAANWLRQHHSEEIIGLNAHRLWRSQGIYGYVLVPEASNRSGGIDTTAAGLERASRLPYISTWLDNYYTEDFKRTIETKFLASQYPVFTAENISSPKRVACRNFHILESWVGRLPWGREVVQWSGGAQFTEGQGCVYPPQWHVKVYENRLFRSPNGTSATGLD